jgi:hypothetical protein
LSILALAVYCVFILLGLFSDLLYFGARTVKNGSDAMAASRYILSYLVGLS